MPASPKSPAPFGPAWCPACPFGFSSWPIIKILIIFAAAIHRSCSIGATDSVMVNSFAHNENTYHDFAPSHSR